MDHSEVKRRLVDDFGYRARAAEIVAERLLSSSPAVQEAFLAWRSADAYPELCVAGYTVARLIREHSMEPVAALLTLDWLSREPERAAASLRKGHDRVVSRSHG